MICVNNKNGTTKTLIGIQMAAAMPPVSAPITTVAAIATSSAEPSVILSRTIAS